MSFLFCIATLATALLGAHSTYYLSHTRKMNSLRAASLSSLVFVALAYAFPTTLLPALQPAFFGSTFVAMSEPYRLSEKKVLLATLVYALFLLLLQQWDFLHFHGGMGGTLGGAAFLACMAVYWAERLALRLKPAKNRTE